MSVRRSSCFLAWKWRGQHDRRQVRQIMKCKGLAVVHTAYTRIVILFNRDFGLQHQGLEVSGSGRCALGPNMCVCGGANSKPRATAGMSKATLKRLIVCLSYFAFREINLKVAHGTLQNIFGNTVATVTVYLGLRVASCTSHHRVATSNFMRQNKTMR